MTHMLVVLATLASAQELQADRGSVPSAGIATESGPGAAWVNPANIAYDPDPRYAVYYGQSLDNAQQPTFVSATTGVGGLAFGIHTITDFSGTLNPRWTVDYTTSVPLPDRVSIGWRIAWHLVTGNSNYVSYDFGTGWRPLPWFGVGAVARNVSNPDPSLESSAQTGAGIALRPLGDLVLLGVDGLAHFEPTGIRQVGVGTLRVRPVEGLYLRAHASSGIDDATPLSYGAGVEIYFDGVGGGGGLTMVGDSPSMTAWFGTDEPGESLIRSGRVVPTLDLQGSLDYEPRATLFSDAGESWLDTLELMRRVENDPGARGMLIRIGTSMSWARMQELRGRIIALEQAGKPVTIYLDGYPSNGAYWLASAASRIVLHPAATLQLTGLAAEMRYMRGTLDMLDIEPQFAKRSEYKSAPEAQTETEPTPAALEQTEAMLDDLYDALVDGIAEGRGVPRDTVVEWIDGGPWTASEAEKAEMVDGLMYADELEADLEETHDGSVTLTDLYWLPQPRSPWEAGQQIAVIYIDGVIVPGSSSSGGLLGGTRAGSDTVVDQLDTARNDQQVRAVVLRVDSPGGSSFASDEIWRAVSRYSEDDKPIVVSMGGVAASGGYYVAAGADAIWAEPTTITGSIGVYTGWPVTGGLTERLGMQTTTIQRGRNATIFSTNEPWDAIERERMEALVDDTYTQFKTRVSDGRRMDMDAVEEVARGRVWTGKRAANNGLVDGLGGLQDAIADARSRAGIPKGKEVAVVTYTGSGTALQSLSPSVIKMLLPQQYGRFQSQEKQLERWRIDAAYSSVLTPSAYPEERIWLLEPTVVKVSQ